jgi:hypothetical protein
MILAVGLFGCSSMLPLRGTAKSEIIPHIRFIKHGNLHTKIWISDTNIWIHTCPLFSIHPLTLSSK